MTINQISITSDFYLIGDDRVEEQYWRSLGQNTDRTISRRVFADRRKLESEKIPRITAVDPDDENTGRDSARTLAVAQNHTTTETPCNSSPQRFGRRRTAVNR